MSMYDIEQNEGLDILCFEKKEFRYCLNVCEDKGHVLK